LSSRGYAPRAGLTTNATMEKSRFGYAVVRIERLKEGDAELEKIRRKEKNGFRIASRQINTNQFPFFCMSYSNVQSVCHGQKNREDLQKGGCGDETGTFGGDTGTGCGWVMKLTLSSSGIFLSGDLNKNMNSGALMRAVCAQVCAKKRFQAYNRMGRIKSGGSSGMQDQGSPGNAKLYLTRGKEAGKTHRG